MAKVRIKALRSRRQTGRTSKAHGRRHGYTEGCYNLPRQVTSVWPDDGQTQIVLTKPSKVLIHPRRRKLMFPLGCSAEASSSHVPHCLLQQEMRPAFKGKQRPEWICAERAMWYEVPATLTSYLPVAPLSKPVP